MNCWTIGFDERWISAGEANLTIETRTALLRQRLGGG